ncbi:metal ABC transporter solute-binding protein, Zn/Mn family [Laceyella tengchongensis]|jgi:manganese/zinc/iron transport system substrate-binding protein|uniref:metal ABC transporter solute-binding protein, Zn/Mn family n=1 Tax=Laceyella tengchongensis TaxID=574699 RepID=UPI0012B7E951|nr:manganese transporter [Laceyella tengchongensis]
MNRIRASLIVLFILPLLFISACQPANKKETHYPLRVTTTTGMIADIVKNVGGKHVQVTSLMGPGVDPHLFKASQGDLQKLDDADLIFYNGLHLEGKMGEILRKIGKTKSVVAVADHLPKNKLLTAEKDQLDPHIWFDVQLWMEATNRVKQTLSQIDPQHRQDYERQTQQYLAKLEQLHEYARQQIGSIPKRQRVLVTAHDAFGYFGRAYDMEVVGLQGINTTAEYGIADVSGLVDLLTSRKIKAVFVESSVPKRSIEAVVQGARQRGHHVHIGGQLFSDAMGEAKTPAGTYIGMVRHNVDVITEALK